MQLQACMPYTTDDSRWQCVQQAHSLQKIYMIISQQHATWVRGNIWPLCAVLRDITHLKTADRHASTTLLYRALFLSRSNKTSRHGLLQ
jgi:hypothetical protein